MAIVLIHTSRCCSSCIHVDKLGMYSCWDPDFKATRKEKPADFVCAHHQTEAEFDLDVHRPEMPLITRVATTPETSPYWYPP